MSADPPALLQHIRHLGAASSRDLQQALDLSQATVSRALAPLLANGELLRTGRGRSQMYVAARAVSGLNTATIPVMKVTATGDVQPFGTLVPTSQGRFWMEEDGGPAQLHGGLPWFLSDMRPQGFLGRAFAQSNVELGFGPNPAYWTDDDTLRALCLAGDDLPGNLIVGSAAFERYMQAPAMAAVPSSRYPQLADAAMQGALPGSSAGGEQPKFCTVRAADKVPVIVKFSPPGTAPGDRRWADLLVCEHLALQVLHDMGEPASRSRLFQASGRTLLEVERFDRTEQGRIGMVSLLAYDSEYIGVVDNWGAAATRMLARGLITPADADRLWFLEAFGALIANTDRHYGNISFILDENGSWRLAPAYDMLPMMYAPVAGELVERHFDPATLSPTADTLAAWPRARGAAQHYWDTVAADKRVSRPFRDEARRHARALAAVPPGVQRPNTIRHALGAG